MSGKYQIYYVYILSSHTGTIYTGVTNDLIHRLDQHKQGTSKSFTKRYNIYRLIYYEETDSIISAREREKQIKGWTRKKKLDLVRTINPTFKDLIVDFVE